MKLIKTKKSIIINQPDMETKSFFLAVLFIAFAQYIVIAQGVRVEPNTKITIETGSTIDLTTGNIVLESDATGDVSLIVFGAVEINNNGKTNAERYFSGSPQAWHLVSAAVGGMAISGSGFSPGDNDDFFAWYEPSPGTWKNYKNTTVAPTFSTVNNGDNFVPAKGYLIAYNASNPSKTFSGNLNTGDVAFTLKNSAGKSWTYSSGWNLIGNPYSSSIDWNLVSRTQFQDNYAYVYDPNKSGGEGYVLVNGANPGAYIGPNQAFFVIATTDANDQDFVFTNALQTHDGGNYLKSSLSDNIVEIRLSSESFYDETTIVLSEKSSFDRDREDGLKINSYNAAIPQLYSISKDDIKLAFNTIPKMESETSIPLGMLIPKEGNYTLSIEANASILEFNDLYIEDKLLEIWYKINDEDYIFTSNAGDIDHRLVLHFKQKDAIVQNDLFKLWAYNNQLFIISEIEQAQLEIIDMQGRLMNSKTITIDGEYTEMLKLQTGMYIVRLSNSSITKTTKIIIN